MIESGDFGRFKCSKEDGALFIELLSTADGATDDVNGLEVILLLKFCVKFEENCLDETFPLVLTFSDDDGSTDNCTRSDVSGTNVLNTPINVERLEKLSPTL